MDNKLHKFGVYDLYDKYLNYYGMVNVYKDKIGLLYIKKNSPTRYKNVQLTHIGRAKVVVDYSPSK